MRNYILLLECIIGESMKNVFQYILRSKIIRALIMMLSISLSQGLNAQQLIWEKEFNNGDDNKGKCITTDNFGNIYVSGYSSHTYPYGLTIKYNEDGDTLWTRRSEMPITDIVCDSYGNIIIAGEIFSEDSLRINMIKFDPDGNILWSYKSSGIYLLESSVFLAVDSKDNIVICCTFDSEFGNDYEILTLKYTSNAGFIWANYYDAYYEEYPVAVTIDNADNILVLGSSNRSRDYDWCILKYDEFGDSLWARRVDVGDYDHPSCIDTDFDGNVYVGGSVGSINEFYERKINKYNPNGELIWSKEFKDTLGYNVGSMINIKTDSNYVFVAGTYSYDDSSGGPWTEYYVAKLNLNMDYIWTYQKISNENMSNIVADMTIDISGNIIVTGRTKQYPNETMENYYTIKIKDIKTGLNESIIFPHSVELYQNYPNPFNPITTVEFALPEPQNIKLQIFDISGRLVETLINGYKEAGNWAVKWDGSRYSSGIYICKLQASNNFLSRKIVLMK